MERPWLVIAIVLGVLAAVWNLAFYTVPLVVVQFLQLKSGDLDVMKRWPLAVQTAFYLFCLYSIVLFGVFRGAAFIYFQF